MILKQVKSNKDFIKIKKKQKQISAVHEHREKRVSRTEEQPLVSKCNGESKWKEVET